MAKKKHSVELVIGAVDNATSEITSLGKSVKLLAGAEVLGAVTKAAQFAGRAVEFLADQALEAAEAAEVQAKAERDLSVAIELSGKFTEGAAKRIAGYAAELQKVSVVGDETSIRMAALAVNFGANEEQTKKMMRAALDMAAALGINATTAMRLLGQAQAGNVQTLARYLPQVRELTEEQKKNGAAIDLVADRYRGAASANLTLGERITQTKNIMGDLNEQIGQSITKSEKLDAVFRGLNETLSRIDFDLDTVLGDTVADFALSTIRMLRITNKAIRGLIADLVSQVVGMMAGPVGSLLAKVGITLGDVGGAQEGGDVETFLARLEGDILKALFVKGPKGPGAGGAGGGRGGGLGGGGGTGDGGPEDLISGAITALGLMDAKLRAMADPAEQIRQKFQKMREEVFSLVDVSGDTPLAQRVFGLIAEAEAAALKKIADAKIAENQRVLDEQRKAVARAEKQAREDALRQQQQELAEWKSLGTSAASAFGSAFAAVMRGDSAENIKKLILQSMIGLITQALGAFGGPGGALAGAFISSAAGGLIQHGGSPGTIPYRTGHGGLLSSEETNVRALRGEAIANRQLVAELGGPAGVAAGNAGLGVGGGKMEIHIHTNDTQTLDDSIRRGNLGDRLAMAFMRRRGPLAGAF